MGIVTYLILAGFAGAGGDADPGDTPGARAGAADRAFHTALDHSTPADGDTLAAPPSEVELVFTAPLDRAGSSLTLLGPAGASWALEPALSSEDRTVLTGALPLLETGEYRIEWRVVSADGHPAEGAFVFHVRPAQSRTGEGGEEGVGVAGAEGAEEEEQEGEEGASDEGEKDTVPGELRIPETSTSSEPEGTAMSALVAAAVGVNVTLLALAGLLAFGAWGPGDPTATTLKSALLLSVGAAVLASIHGWLWTGDVLGDGAGLGERAGAAFSFTSGREVVGRISLAWATLGIVALTRRLGVAAILALLAVGAGALGGHMAGAADVLAVPANAIHLLAVTAWLGGLVFIVTQRTVPDHSEAVLRVSAVALLAAGLVVLTGVLQAWFLLDSPAELVGTTYGRLVMLKAAGLTVLVGFGAFNRFRLIPKMRRDGDTARLTRSVRIELGVASAVVVVASALAHVPPPG